MKTRIHRYLPLLLAALLPLLLCSCTAVGAYMGHRIDKENARVVLHAGGMNADTIPVGCRVNVTLMNGQTITGKFKGLQPLPDEDYAADYAAAQISLNSIVNLPNLGDTLTVMRTSGQRMDLVFRGFGPQALAMNNSRSPLPQYFPLTDAATLTTYGGQPISLERIRTLMNARRLPLDMGIALGSGTTPQPIPLSHVLEIRTEPRRTHWWIAGAGIGFVADFCVAAVAVATYMGPKKSERLIL